MVNGNVDMWNAIHLLRDRMFHCLAITSYTKLAAQWAYLHHPSVGITNMSHHAWLSGPHASMTSIFSTLSTLPMPTLPIL